MKAACFKFIKGPVGDDPPYPLPLKRPGIC